MEIEECKPGEVYKLSYKLNGRRHIRYAQLLYLGYRESGTGKMSQWSGRPNIGTLSFMRGEIYTIHRPSEDGNKTIYFDRRSPE